MTETIERPDDRSGTPPDNQELPLVGIERIIFDARPLYDFGHRSPSRVVEPDWPTIQGTLYWENTPLSSFQIEMTPDERIAMQAVLQAIGERVQDQFRKDT